MRAKTVKELTPAERGVITWLFMIRGYTPEAIARKIRQPLAAVMAIWRENGIKNETK